MYLFNKQAAYIIGKGPVMGKVTTHHLYTTQLSMYEDTIIWFNYSISLNAVYIMLALHHRASLVRSYLEINCK